MSPIHAFRRKTTEGQEKSRINNESTNGFMPGLFLSEGVSLKFYSNPWRTNILYYIFVFIMKIIYYLNRTILFSKARITYVC